MMKKVTILFLFTAMLISQITAVKAEDKWITGYYAGWMFKYLPPEDVDYNSLTHVIHFSALPNEDGSLDLDTHKITLEYSNRLTKQSHLANKKVLISVGGSNFRKEFLQATNQENRKYFIKNLINLLQERNYDGIDIDWEPLLDDDVEQYVSFVKELRTELNRLSPRPLLTSALMGNDFIAGSRIYNFLDQVNIMTYSLADPSWVNYAWHSSAIYGGKPDGSIHNIVTDWINAGVPKEKIGIGMIFYGKQWNGVSNPKESWEETPEIVSSIPYHKIISEYTKNAEQKWDSEAKAAYLSSENFLSFDNEESAREKMAYIHENGLGGIILWEIGAGYLADNEEGEKHPLLKAVSSPVVQVETNYTESGDVVVNFSLFENLWEFIKKLIEQIF